MGSQEKRLWPPVGATQSPQIPREQSSQPQGILPPQQWGQEMFQLLIFTEIIPALPWGSSQLEEVLCSTSSAQEIFFFFPSFLNEILRFQPHSHTTEPMVAGQSSRGFLLFSWRAWSTKHNRKTWEARKTWKYFTSQLLNCFRFSWARLQGPSASFKKFLKEMNGRWKNQMEDWHQNWQIWMGKKAPI